MKISALNPASRLPASRLSVGRFLANRSLHELAGLFGLIAMVAVLPVSVGLVASLSGLASGPATTVDVINFAAKRIVSVQEARALIASGALVLDARDADSRAANPLPQAQPIAWSDLASATGPDHGRLSDDDEQLANRLQALGVSAAQPVVVIGEPLLGTDDDARIVLALRALGHHRSVLVNGGLSALQAAGLPTIYPPFGRGSFVVSRQQDWHLAPGTVADDTLPADMAVIDTRRSMRRAGTRQIALDAFRAADGRAIDAAAVGQLLAIHGIDEGTRLVTYGGDSDGSGWVAALLLDLGYDVAGYVTEPDNAVAGQIGTTTPAILN